MLSDRQGSDNRRKEKKMEIVRVICFDRENYPAAIIPFPFYGTKDAYARTRDIVNQLLFCSGDRTAAAKELMAYAEKMLPDTSASDRDRFVFFYPDIGRVNVSGLYEVMDPAATDPAFLSDDLEHVPVVAASRAGMYSLVEDPKTFWESAVFRDRDSDLLLKLSPRS